MVTAEVTFIGSSPASAVAGRILAEMGHGVLIIKNKKSQIDKISACFLNEKGISLLNDKSFDTITLPPHHKLKEIHLVHKGKTQIIKSKGGIIVSRYDLEASLLARAKEAGCTVLEDEKPELTSGIPTIEGKNLPKIKTKIACIPKVLGSRSHLNKNLKLEFGALDSSPGLSSLSEGIIQMTLSSNGYLTKTHMPDGSYVYACAISNKAAKNKNSIGKELGEIFSLNELNDLTWIESDLPERAKDKLADGNCLTIGDSLGCIEPFIGHGMGWAMNSGALVAPMISEELKNDTGNLGAKWSKLFKKELSSKGINSISSLMISYPSITLPLFKIPFIPEKALLKRMYV